MKRNKQYNRSLNLKKYFLITVGTISLIIGVIGIIIPLLPTTPLLLLSAACYAKSSERLYHFLTTNKLFGSYIKHYHEGKGLPFNIKIFTIILLWSSILFSITFIIESFWVAILLLIIAFLVSIHIIIIKTYEE